MGDVNNSYARIDFVILMHGHVIFLEVDEHQHNFGYGPISCDMRRMSKIVESLFIEGNTLPIIFIRYNPNSFIVDDVHVSCLKRDRENTLIDIISDSSSNIYENNRSLKILYMYYDTTDGVANVVSSNEYNPMMVSCCCPPIF